MLGRGTSIRVCRVGTAFSAGLTKAATPPSRWITLLNHVDICQGTIVPSTSSVTAAVRLGANRRSYLTMSSAAHSTSAGVSGEKVGDVNSDEGFREQKKTLRKCMKLELKAMSKSAVDTSSAAVAERLLEAPELAEGGSGGGAVSIYLSMPGELDTAAVVSELFKRGKKIYIPKVGSEV